MRKTGTTILAAAILSAALAWPHRGMAQEESGGYLLQTGADLARICANPATEGEIAPAERQRLLICGAYIQGFLAHYGFVRRNLADPSFCLPESGISGDGVRKLFLSLLEKRPQIQDLPASIDLATALAWGYPCKAPATAGNETSPEKEEADEPQ